jgi:3-deoxy-manno-octulosonate cytidylyltransferase (CMP-KDO synthetase)
MHIVGIVPARMGSSRFPGKPLARIHGMPMIGHVYLRSAMASSLNGVYIATCDREIAEYVASIGAPAIMTSDTHERASDRAAEAVGTIERSIGRPVDVAVMIQGDEPMVTPAMIDRAVEALVSDARAPVVNLMGPIDDAEGLADPNEIKVVTDLEGFALYFSRSPIPHGRGAGTGRKQICIIPFRRDFLTTFNQLASTPLEMAESVDMMRVLEHGYRVKMVDAGADTVSVDTPEDLADVEALMRGDALMVRYLEGPW